jgi:DNA-binding response OmpR family regulator
METAMLVEAGPKRRKLLSELLEEEGLNVESVKTAEEALSRAAKSAPGLVLLDIHMPTVSGLEVLKQLRGMDVRIILLTANESAAVRHNLYSFGDVIAGAVETTAFQARFRGILERHSRENQRRVRVASSAHPVSSHVLAELHDPESGRLDAGRIASFLGTPLSNLAKFSQVSVAGLHKSPRSVSVQPHLIPIARSLAILTQLLSSKESVLAWMNSPHPDLGGETPLTLILHGKAQVVADLLEAALAGQPS